MIRLSAATFALVAACGGRTELSSRVQGAEGDGGDGSSVTDASDDYDTGPSGPCIAAGVRICGGECPWLQPPLCPGKGCTPSRDRTTFESTPAGACWADMTGGDGVDLCEGCTDGEVCVQREADKLVCASVAVCDALRAKGAVTACRYADKSSYDGSPLAEPAGACPASTQGALCGGACGPCPTGWASSRCTGRSAHRPWGVCPSPLLSGGSATALLNGCAVDANGKWTRACELPTLLGPNGKMELARCLVFDVAPQDMPAARAWGLCSPRSVCQAAAHTAGGIHCFAPDGADDL